MLVYFLLAQFSGCAVLCHASGPDGLCQRIAGPDPG
jgi:hypothetical protein